MKILIWTQHFWPEDFLINEITEGLANSELDITVLTGKPNYPDGQIYEGYELLAVERQNYRCVKVIRVPIWPRGKSRPIELFINYFSFVFSALLLSPFLLYGKKFDLIFVFGTTPIIQAIPAICVAKLKRSKTILWVQDLWPETVYDYSNNFFIRAIAKAASKTVYRSVDKILVQSQSFIKPIAENVNSGRQIAYFPNPQSRLSIPSFSTCDNPLLSQVEKLFSILLVGNVGSAQGYEKILESAELLKGHPDIKFFILGSGRDLIKIKELASRMCLTNIEFVGKVEKDLLPSFYGAASMLIVSLRPGLAFSKTVPRRLHEYFAAGKAVLAVGDVSGEVAGIVKSVGCGMVASSENPGDIARQVLSMKNLQGDGLDAMGLRGKRHWEENLSFEKLTPKLLSIFREATLK